MIRKIAIKLCLVIIMTVAGTASAQKCIPDQNVKRPGFYPDTLAHATVGVPYNETISILSVRDTVYLTFQVQIDSIKALDILGLPPKFAYECQNPDCIFVWDTVRCVRLYGTPDYPGVFKLKIPVVFYAKLGSSPIIQTDTLKNFKIVIDWGLGSHFIADGSPLKLYPNPARQELNIALFSDRKDPEFKIYDLTGRRLTTDFKELNNIYSADVSKLNSGIYFVLFEGNKYKFIKN